MESQDQPKAQNQSRTDNAEKTKKVKKDRFAWWQSLIILVATLVICLSAGYYVSAKYLWNSNNDQIEKQLQFYQAEVDQKPNDPNLRIQLGYAYLLKGDTDNAIKQYLNAKDLDKNNYSAYLNLSIAYDQKKQTDDALQMALKAVKLAPRDYKGQMMAGRCYRKLKMYKKASEYLDEAIRLKPGNTDILYEIGLVAEGQGNKKAAEQIYKEALSYDPTYKPAINALDRLSK